jgi:hypothetical protein
VQVVRGSATRWKYCTIDNPLGYDCSRWLPATRESQIATMEMSALSIRAALRRGCEYHSANCDSVYACDDNICDPLWPFNVKVPWTRMVPMSVRSPGLPCDLTTDATNPRSVMDLLVCCQEVELHELTVDVWARRAASFQELWLMQ